MTGANYRCEGCGLEWTPTRADGRRNGQRCPRCGGALVRTTTTLEDVARDDARLAAERLVALEDIARAVAVGPVLYNGAARYQCYRCAYCAASFVYGRFEHRPNSDTARARAAAGTVHAPGCPVSRARTLLGEEVR